MVPWILLICHDHLFLHNYLHTHQHVQIHIPTHTCTNVYQHIHVPTCIYTRTKIYMYTHINIYMYTYQQHIHAPTCTNKHTYHDIRIHTPTPLTSIPPYTHHQVLSIYGTQMLPRHSYSRMLSQHLKLTCIRGNSITIFIPRNQDTNVRNPSTILIRFLHTICRPLQIAPVHY